MKITDIPKIHKDQIPYVMYTVRQRMLETGLDNPALSKKTGLKIGQITQMFGNNSFSGEQLMQVLLALNDNPLNTDDRPFHEGMTLREFTDWGVANNSRISQLLPDHQTKLDAHKQAREVEQQKYALALGAQLKARREEISQSLGRLVSQQDVADHVEARVNGRQKRGISKQAVANLEAGDFDPDSQKTVLPAIITALGYPEATPRSLMEDAPSMPPWTKHLAAATSAHAVRWARQQETKVQR